MREGSSGRERPDQTYPSESGRTHIPAPPTEDPANKRANQPETAETYADDLEHRPEDRPDMAHRTGGRDLDRADSLRPDVEAPLADGNEPVRGHEDTGEQPGIEPVDSGMGAGDRPDIEPVEGTLLPGGADEDPSIRNEKQVVADSQAEFPPEDRAFEWRGGTAMPNERTGELYYTPQEPPPDKKPRSKRKAFAVTAMAAGIGLVALTRMRKRR
jgi:hypothetical protein